MPANMRCHPQWDHVDHQFGFIGHWTEWCFDFEKYAAGDAAVLPPPSSEAPPQKTGADDGDEAKPEAPAVPMAVWRQRADELSADVGAIKARLLERSERMDNLEDDHTVRVVKRLSSLTQRMDVLNNVSIVALPCTRSLSSLRASTFSEEQSRSWNDDYVYV